MSRRNDRGALQDMRDYAREALGMFGEASADALETDRQLQLSLCYLIQIVGEAAARVSADTRETYPEIPWSRIVGMRNRIAHGYDQVVMEIVQDTVAIELPKLIRQLTVILGEDSGEAG